jgi:hypothetical protein
MNQQQGPLKETIRQFSLIIYDVISYFLCGSLYYAVSDYRLYSVKWEDHS